MTHALALGAGLLLSACAQAPLHEQRGGRAWPAVERVTLAEPAADEVVIVINDNVVGGRHAGLFTGARLIDPSGTYLAVRSENPSWTGPTLRDYVNYQMEDGDKVFAYRFSLPRAEFMSIEARIGQGGWSMPLFCAAKLQDYLAGIGPFRDLAAVWWTSPRELGAQLDRITRDPGGLGICERPDRKPCHFKEAA